MLEPAWTRDDALAAGVISATDPGFYDVDRENEVFRRCRVKVAWFAFEPLKPEDVPLLCQNAPPAPKEPHYAKEIFAQERRRWGVLRFLQKTIPQSVS